MDLLFNGNQLGFGEDFIEDKIFSLPQVSPGVLREEEGDRSKLGRWATAGPGARLGCQCEMKKRREALAGPAPRGIENLFLLQILGS
jgi:hypothetical protein